ncbi:MAG: DinB family protein [bacterium]
MKTTAQRLADQVREQIGSGKALLDQAGDNASAVFGVPSDVLSVKGNVADVGLTNHLWLLDLVNGGIFDRNQLESALNVARPSTTDEAIAFLEPRDTFNAEEALAALDMVNEDLAALVEDLEDDVLDKNVDMTFYGRMTVADLLFIVITHGALHLGQGWGILKAMGQAD